MARAIVAGAFVLLFALPASAGGGFLREQGSLYAKLDYTYFRSPDFFTLEGERRGRLALEQQAVNLYAEYGLLDFLTLDLFMPVTRLHAFEGSEQVVGPGDLRLGASLGGRWAGFSLSGGVAVEIPTGRDTAFSATDDEGGRINLPTGDGEPNVWFRLGASRSFPELRAYVSLEAAYNLRTTRITAEDGEGFTDQVAIVGEVGHHLFEVAWLRAGVRSLFTVGGDPQPAASFIYGEGTEFLAVYAGASVRVLGPVSLTADWFDVVALRRNVFGGSSFGAGVAIDL